MRIWIVTERDYDNTWIVAVYPTETMASQHVGLMGGDVEEKEVLESLHRDAVDPVKQKERSDRAEQERKIWEYRRAIETSDARARAETRPTPPHMYLCHCETFSSARNFVNDHGYCSYCGGFVHEVYREHMGPAALGMEIDKLAIHDREKMRSIALAHGQEDGPARGT